MAIQITTNINVDFCDKKYILINAKQLDKSSRFLSVNCYNHGEPYHLYAGEHSAYIRYKKPDGHGVFNFCEIDNKGRIIVRLTEQMLINDGICYADLVIVNKGKAEVNAETGEIVAIDNTSVLSTMTFCIDVSEMAVLNSEIESTYEFNLVNTTLERYWSDYEDVMLTSKSWAVGNTGIDRPNENIDNSKYYCEQSNAEAVKSAASALSAAGSADSANTFMKDALTYKGLAETYKNEAESYMNNASISEANAKTSETNAKISEANSKTSETNASKSESNAKTSETNAKTSEENAADSESNASTSEKNALNSANLAQSYAVGGTGIRDGEDVDNVHYYYELVKTVVNGFNSGFIPMGTISFAELAMAEKVTGFTYNISDDFTTDETFAEGAGKSYTAGTNVYCRLDGLWDCFGGTATPIATVDEVKSYLNI